MEPKKILAISASCLGRSESLSKSTTTENSMLRLGVAGLGFMGQIHLKNYLDHPNAKVVALADKDADRRGGNLPDLKLDMGTITSYADTLEMCTVDGIDMVSICLPTDLHAEAAIAALETGKHVFCEKPIDLSVEQGQRMLQAAAASGKILMVGHCLRFWPEYVAVEQCIRSRRFGRALAASFTRCRELPTWDIGSWFSNPQRSGGVAIDLHIHDADLCIWWWGKPSEISAGGTYVGENPSVLHSRWRYEDGLAIQFESTWENVRSAPFYYGFKITLERATLLYDSRNDKGLQLATEGILECVPVEATCAYELEDRYFLDCVTDRKPVERCPPEESLLSLECVIEENRQLRQLKQ